MGRHTLVDEIVERLSGPTRLISLVGLGGIGKTSVAIAAAVRIAADGRDVWFVDLSAANDSITSADAVLRALGVEVSAEPVESLAVGG